MIPVSMKAVEFSASGGPDVIRVVERPVPQPGPGEVLVKVAAAGLNRADSQQRKGFYPPPPGASDIPGLEISGTIVSRGPGVTEYDDAAQVCALLTGGGYAEYAVVPVGQLFPVPAKVSLVEAAALPEVAATVWSNLGMTAKVSSGEWVLIHGASGGIGTMAVQVCKALGAKPIVTGSSAEKLEYALQLGAVAGINYREEDFSQRIQEITDGHGADVILDVVGAKYLAQNVASLALEGRMVVIGLLGGRTAELDMGQVLSRRLSIQGTTLRSRSLEAKAEIVAETLRHVWPLIESGEVSVPVDKTFALEDAVAAHEYFESGEFRGKVLLTIT
ncbi:NAD(P)H-quinone oxidoreductase [Neomicrococcus lactis]|uniref:Putative PIG3 family NAD(P)H quinone oxidoreductase n=2 Tax=Neomicrococcus lactis TaxID=732241 RepID=A0A7W8YBG7_9MICC|nr:putative PIG3 family NAD(P)H quinone oxidoreductase [Neomicrococcus lactis]